MKNHALTSLHKNSRILDLRTFRPSALLEYGVLPAPLSCISHLSPSRFKTSPRYLKENNKSKTFTKSCTVGILYDDGILQYHGILSDLIYAFVDNFLCY
jgi:hypothetical protein